MTKSENVIKKEIGAHIDKEGSGYSVWYVGITNDAKRRVHEDHGVPEENAWYIWRTARSDAVAGRVEKHFIGLGCDGAPGGGEEDAKAVYAYKKTDATDP